MALTIPRIRALKHDPTGPSTQILFDDGEGSIPGFGVRVFKTGVKSFVVWYRTTTGRKRLHTIGRFGEAGGMTLDTARKTAADTRSKVRTGTDPVEEKRSARAGETLKEFADVFMRDHRLKNGQRKKSAAEDRWRLDKHILPKLGSRKLTEITRTNLRRFHFELGERSNAEANRAVALLSVMYRRASEWGYLPEDYPNPARGIQKYTIPSRDRFVTPEEMPALVDSIRQEENVYLRAAVWIYLLSGMRKSELLKLKWGAVDLTRAEIRLEDTKSGRSHIVPLSAPALAVLKDLPRQLTNAYVLPGRLQGKPMVNINKAWGRIRRRAELEDVRLHDLRRTVGSWMAQDGASLHLIGSVLGHSNAATTAIYARLGEDPARKALERHGERMQQFLGGGARAQ